VRLSDRLRKVEQELYSLGFDAWSDDVEQAAIIVAIVESLPGLENCESAVAELKKLGTAFETRMWSKGVAK